VHHQLRRTDQLTPVVVRTWYRYDLLYCNEVFTMKTYLNLGDPGMTDRVDDLLRMDGDTTIE
jgi:hypothetical protein